MDAHHFVVRGDVQVSLSYVTVDVGSADGEVRICRHEQDPPLRVWY